MAYCEYHTAKIKIAVAESCHEVPAIKNKKEENKMDTVELQRLHLRDRARETKWSKEIELRKAFNIDPVASPVTLDDLIDRLSKGKFVFADKYKTREFYSADELVRKIDWRDPAQPADTEGFNKAMTALNTEYQTLKDTIIIEDPKVGLEAYRAFEAKIFS